MMRLSPFLVAVLLGVASASCVGKIAYQPTAAAQPRMSRAQAVERMKTVLAGGQPDCVGASVSELEARGDGFRFVYQLRTPGGRSKGSPASHTVSYASTDPTVHSNMGWIWVELGHVPDSGSVNLRFSSLENAKAFADVLYVLKNQPANYAPPEDPRAEVAFVEEAKRYRALTTKPEIPEEVRRFKVQAEFAIEQKRFDDAVNLYEDGLRVSPLWPEGYFNRALVLGELSRYVEAIRAMKKYLLLAPDAPDARAAQDRIYQWESAVVPPRAGNP